ncbi:MAG: class I SAM-dependent methyltransferase [Actinomycetota bacterium]
MSAGDDPTGDPPDDRTRWNRRYAAVAPLDDPGPPAAMARLAGALPDPAGLQAGPVVDLAGGTGEGARLLGRRLRRPAVLVDVSDEALSIAADRAAEDGTALTTFRLDLAGRELSDVVADLCSRPGFGPIPPSVVTCTHYLDRTLLGSVAAGLPPGGAFGCSIATVVNLERHQRPSARFLLEPGELPALVVGSTIAVDVLHQEEGWTPEGTHEAALVVRRPR